MRFWQEFQRIEWTKNEETNLLVDPISIQVVLHDKNHITYMEGEAIRASTGRYYVDFDTAQLIPGQYTVFWRFEPIADVVQIKRQEFVHDRKWQETVDGYCLVHGAEYDGVGIPLYHKSITVVQYEDFASKDRILSKVETFTDAQGVWSATLQWAGVYQIIKDNRLSKVFRVPNQHLADYNSLPSYNDSIINVDKFGNPTDGTLKSALNTLYLGNRQNVHD